MNRKIVVSLLVLALGVAVAAGAFLTGKDQAVSAAAMTELKIGNLSCGSCVSNVKTALAKVEGVGQVDVSVTNGRGQVTYDPSLTNAAEIARIVSDAGYPATVRLDLSAADFAKSLSESEQLGALYVARIGNRLLSRDDFNAALSLRGAGLTPGVTPYANQQLQTQVWQELKEREILLAAADKNKIVVQDGEVDHEIQKMKSATKDFDALVVARFGSPDRFFSQLKESMIINRNIEQNVFAGLTTEREKQLRFTQWYDETLQNTNVLIFDPAIKQAEAAGSSSCGGSCGSK
jgi:copper chaperone CopZ